MINLETRSGVTGGTRVAIERRLAKELCGSSRARACWLLGVLGSIPWPVSAAASDAPLAPAISVEDLPPLPYVADHEDKLIEVAVQKAAQVDEFVVVGASKREQSLGTVASAVTVIPADQLRRFGHRTLAEALRATVGLYLVDDRMIERVGIRGIQLLGDANTRILVLIDGSTVNEPWSQGVDTSYALPVHIDDVARIEVIRGPVSSVYGTNAFLGIVNIITLEADKAPRAYGRVGAGSFASATANTGVSIGDVNRQVRGFLSLMRRGGETLTYPAFGAGDAAVTDADGAYAINGAAVAHYDRLFFQARVSRRARQLPGAPYDSAIASQDNRNTDTYLLSEVGYTRDLTDKFTVASRVYGNQYNHRAELAADFDGDGQLGFVSEGVAHWLGGEVRSHVAILPKGQLDLVTGAAAELAHTGAKSVNSGATSTAVLVDTDFNTQGVYAELSAAPLPWLALTGGVRLDRHSLFENNLSPRGALFLSQGKSYGLKLLFAEGFRNPSPFETFFVDGARHRPAWPDSAGNPVILFPEVITSYEVVGWMRPFSGANLRLSAWRWDLEKIIEKRSFFVGEGINAPRLQFQNLAKLRSQGLELEGLYRDSRGWLAFANATLAAVERNGGLEVAVNAPQVTANLGLSSPLLLSLGHLSSELTVIGPRKTRAPESSPDEQAGRFVGWNIVAYLPRYRGFDFTIGVRNVLGFREEIPAQIDYDREDRTLDIYLVPGAGREFFARMGYML
jgi:outer membrane receptor for ferrienterochelin and colicins